MRPFFFGPDRGLFGCYHPAGADAAPAAAGVVMCNALFGEYVQQHRLYNRLAERLAGLGVPTLRFDWYGTGDSAGDLDGTDLDRWRADLAAAMTWLRRQARLAPVVLVGARIGATLASAAARDDADVPGLALWEPVSNGADYLAELTAEHEKGLGRYLAGTPKEPGRTELLGFTVPDPLLAELAALRLAAPRAETATLVVGGAASVAAARSVLDPAAAPVRYDETTFPPGWLQPEEAIYDVLVPAVAMRATADWIAGLAR